MLDDARMRPVQSILQPSEMVLIVLPGNLSLDGVDRALHALHALVYEADLVAVREVSRHILLLVV